MIVERNANTLVASRMSLMFEIARETAREEKISVIALGYKIMERSDIAGHFKTLFHGNFGSRTVEAQKYLKAQIRPEAYDGSRSTTYRSGWHTLRSYELAVQYLKRFTTRPEKLCIVMCSISGNIRRKPTNDQVILSDGIVLLEEVRNDSAT